MVTGQKRISVALITYNEEANIRACLDSVKWADEIVVVDSHSTDGTPGIAREYAEKVFARDWNGINEQRQFALEQCTGEWVLCVDADERVTPELRDEIRDLFAAGEPDCDGFLIPRRTFFLGRWIRHCGWYPGRKLRLFRREKARFGDNDPHDRVLLDGSTRTLKNDLLHFTYRDLSHNARTVNTFTSVRADRLLAVGAGAGFLDLTVRPLWRFFQQYVLRLGFLDGMPGLIICGMSAFRVFLRHAKIWEGAEQGTRHEEGETPSDE